MTLGFPISGELTRYCGTPSPSPTHVHAHKLPCKPYQHAKESTLCAPLKKLRGNSSDNPLNDCLSYGAVQRLPRVSHAFQSVYDHLKGH